MGPGIAGCLQVVGPGIARLAAGCRAGFHTGCLPVIGPGILQVDFRVLGWVQTTGRIPT